MGQCLGPLCLMLRVLAQGLEGGYPLVTWQAAIDTASGVLSVF